jgi:uncharacterized membrane protein YvbJ
MSSEWRDTMVFCKKCGSQNLDEAKFCSNCGADLAAPQEESWDKRLEKWGEDFEKQMDEWGDDFGKRVEEECFGLPQGGAIVGLAFGAFIIIIGIALYFGQDIGRWIGPSAAIVFGILIVTGAIYGLTRRRR